MSKSGVRTALAIGAAALGLAVSASPAAAAACATPSTSYALAAWGDLDAYFLAPGGDFEGAHGWQLGRGASITRRLRYVPGIGAQQLELAPGGAATSPALCIDGTRRHLRVGLRASSSTAVLRVEAVVVGRSTTLAVVTGGRYDDFRLSDDIMLAGPLALPAGATKQAQLRFTATSGTWQVDGVWVDPRRS